MSDTQEIQQVLSRFRSSIQRYVLIEGIAGFVAVACTFFWVTYGIDWAHFQLRSLELPGWFRIASTVLMTAVLVGGTLTWVLARLFRQFRSRDLALALERRHPELNDRLITAVELESRPPTSELQQAMVAKTTTAAATDISKLDISDAFNNAPLKRLSIAAAALLSTVLIFGIANAQGMGRWADAYLFGRSDYWEPFRKNALSVHVLAQPGDRKREFDAEGVYRHPRGAELQFVVQSNEETTPPDDVFLQFISFGGASRQRGNVTMSRISDSEFRHTITSVVDDHHLWVRGGDFINRRPLRVLVVDPPQIAELELQCDYPEYINWEGREDSPVRVVGTQATLPLETKFELNANLNKPLVRVHLDTKEMSMTFGFEEQDGTLSPQETQLTLRDSETNDVTTLKLGHDPFELFNKERTAFKIPLWVTAKAQQEYAKLKGGSTAPLPIPADTTIQISLEDEDGIYSPEPTTLTVLGIVDEAPVVDSRRTGVGTAVTRVASIPIEGTLTDDYGVTSAWFEHRLASDPNAVKTPLENLPSGQKLFPLERNETEAVERFNLLPLKLQEGEMLTLGVHAQDADHLNGPHSAHGELFTFKIVSRDELLGMLTDREMTLRLRFEQIETETKKLRAQLAEHKAVAKTYELPDSATGNERVLLSSFAERSLHQLRKNQTESRSIEIAFQSIRAEMVNNRVDSKELLDRIDNGVISPMQLLNEKHFLDADRKCSLIRLALERETDIEAAIDTTIPAVDLLLQQMEKILAEMRDRGTFNDLIQNLESIIEQQKKLLDETENKRIEENFFSPIE